MKPPALDIDDWWSQLQIWSALTTAHTPEVSPTGSGSEQRPDQARILQLQGRLGYLEAANAKRIWDPLLCHPHLVWIAGDRCSVAAARRRRGRPERIDTGLQRGRDGVRPQVIDHVFVAVLLQAPHHIVGFEGYHVSPRLLADA